MSFLVGRCLPRWRPPIGSACPANRPQFRNIETSEDVGIHAGSIPTRSGPSRMWNGYANR